MSVFLNGIVNAFYSGVDFLISSQGEKAKAKAQAAAAPPSTATTTVPPSTIRVAAPISSSAPTTTVASTSSSVTNAALPYLFNNSSCTCSLCKGNNSSASASSSSSTKTKATEKDNTPPPPPKVVKKDESAVAKKGKEVAKKRTFTPLEVTVKGQGMVYWVRTLTGRTLVLDDKIGKENTLNDVVKCAYNRLNENVDEPIDITTLKVIYAGRSLDHRNDKTTLANLRRIYDEIESSSFIVDLSRLIPDDLMKYAAQISGSGRTGKTIADCFAVAVNWASRVERGKEDLALTDLAEFSYVPKEFDEQIEKYEKQIKEKEKSDKIGDQNAAKSMTQVVARAKGIKELLEVNLAGVRRDPRRLLFGLKVNRFLLTDIFKIDVPNVNHTILSYMAYSGEAYQYIPMIVKTLTVKFHNTTVSGIHFTILSYIDQEDAKIYNIIHTLMTGGTALFLKDSTDTTITKGEADGLLKDFSKKFKRDPAEKLRQIVTFVKNLKVRALRARNHLKH